MIYIEMGNDINVDAVIDDSFLGSMFSQIDYIHLQAPSVYHNIYIRMNCIIV